MGHGRRCYAVGDGLRDARRAGVVAARRAAARRSPSRGARGRPADRRRRPRSAGAAGRRAARGAPRVTASTSSQAGSSPLSTPCRSRSWPAPARRSRRPASISRTPGLAVGLGPGLDERHLARARRRTRRSSRCRARWRSPAARRWSSPGRGGAASSSRPARGDLVAGQADQLVLAREVACRWPRPTGRSRGRRPRWSSCDSPSRRRRGPRRRGSGRGPPARGRR